MSTTENMLGLYEYEEDEYEDFLFLSLSLELEELEDPATSAAVTAVAAISNELIKKRPKEIFVAVNAAGYIFSAHNERINRFLLLERTAERTFSSDEKLYTISPSSFTFIVDEVNRLMVQENILLFRLYLLEHTVSDDPTT